VVTCFLTSVLRNLTCVAAGGGAMERAEALASLVSTAQLLNPPQRNAIR
jgi:hypothetical protein